MPESSDTKSSVDRPEARSIPTPALTVTLPLAYATDLPLYGIAYEVNGELARIAVPTSKRPIFQVIQLVVPLFLLLYAVSGVVSITLQFRQAPTILQVDVCGVVFNAGLAFILGSAAYVGLCSWFRARSRQTVFELTADRLVLHDFSPNGSPRTRSWDRKLIADVRAGPVPWNASELQGLGLHIRITGKTILEVMPGHEPQVARWVADRLNQALQSPIV